MELQALLVLCGVGVAGVAVVLLMGLFSASGTSYEEAIAQQRRATTELLALAEGKNKPKKKNKKAIKKLAKKERKENASGMTGSEVESEGPADSGAEDDNQPAPKPHVEFCPPVVVDIPTDSPLNIKIRKRGKDLKVKPILINKDDPSCLTDPSTPPSPTSSTVSNHFEEIHPKDEFELLHSSLAVDKAVEKKDEIVEKKEVKPSKAVKGSKVAPKTIVPAAEPVKEDVKEERATSEAPKEQRKGKKIEKKSVGEVAPEIFREEVIVPLNVPQPSELTTEKLLKQALASVPAPATAVPAPSPSGGKGKKKKPDNVLALIAAGEGGGVNVGELVLLLKEAALSRNEIQILTDALLNKHHDPLPEHSEWTEGPNNPMMKLKKQLADKEKALADEMDASKALHAKLKELRASLNTERSRAAATARAAEEAAGVARAELHTMQARLQRLLDDNHLLQSKLGSEGERVQMELHIQRLTEAEAALVAQLTQLQAEAGARALEAGQARCDAAAARDSLVLAQQHHQDLIQQLQDLERAYNEVEQLRQCSEQRAQADQRHAQETLAAMGDLQNEMQRVTARLQSAESEVEKLKQDIEKDKQQWSNEVTSLKEQLSSREAELAEARQLRTPPAHNGLPTTDNNNSEQHKSGELAKVESALEALRNELATAQSCNRDQREQLDSLQRQLAAHKDKNDELRTKNWKIMEALQSAEKALHNKTASALPAQELTEAIAKAQESQFVEISNVLRTIGPFVTPAPTAAGSRRAWVQTVADAVRKELDSRAKQADALQTQLRTAVASANATTDAPPANKAALDALQAENERLQSVVDRYKRIIDDTEGVLSRLQQDVTREEARWAHQLAETQKELQDLRNKTVLQMQKKIDSLQEELQQARASNHNHSFADTERLAQENLLSGLSDKYKVDSCNGPLQVGLEEK